MSIDFGSASTSPAALEIGVFQATDLARAGDYAGAERVLDGFPDAPAALDLRARIHAQRGQLAEAAAAWRALCDQRPDDVDARAGLVRVHSLQRGGYPGRRVGRMALFALGLAFGVTMAVGALRGSNPVASPSPAPASQDGRQIARAVSEALVPLLNERPAPPPPEPTTAVGARALDELRRVLATDSAIDVSPDEGELVVRFRDPLFQREDVLQPQAAATLTRVATALAPFAERVKVTIVGQTDDKPVTRTSRFPSNVAVGMARAVAVFRHFGEHDGLPPGLFALRSPGVADGTLGEGNPSDAQRRTATLRVLATPQR
jgi:flagellar motor protein MotB